MSNSPWKSFINFLMLRLTFDCLLIQYKGTFKKKKKKHFDDWNIDSCWGKLLHPMHCSTLLWPWILSPLSTSACFYFYQFICQCKCRYRLLIPSFCMSTDSIVAQLTSVTYFCFLTFNLMLNQTGHRIAGHSSRVSGKYSAAPV